MCKCHVNLVSVPMNMTDTSVIGKIKRSFLHNAYFWTFIPRINGSIHTSLLCKNCTLDSLVISPSFFFIIYTF